jgi:hypothetical protein
MAEETPLRLWITAKALTRGIQEMEGHRTSDRYVCVRTPAGYHQAYRIGVDAFLSLDGAIANAEARRLRRIERLKLQLAHLERKRFPQT